MATSAAPRRLAWFSVAAAMLLGLVGLAWSFIHRSMDASAFVSHTHAVMSAIGEAESQMFRAEASQRGFYVALDGRLAHEAEIGMNEVDRVMDGLEAATRDNPAQQRRIATLRALQQARFDAMRETQRRLLGGAEMSAQDRLRDGAAERERSHLVFASMMADERQLLAQREATEAERVRIADSTIAALGGAMLLLLPWFGWRLRIDAKARGRAEALAERESRYAEIHSRALTLYNGENQAGAILEGTFALLAEGGLFPAAAYYAHVELGGTLSLQAVRAAPAGLPPIVRLDDGALGSVASKRETVMLGPIDDRLGFTIEGGLAQLKPAALLLCPVGHQNRLLGVLVLAASTPPGERERTFVERLAAQLGIALHNLQQLEGLHSLAGELRERSADVEHKNDELQRATRMKSEFVANMSHELRTPLNAIIGFSEILRDGMAGPLSAEQSEFVGNVHSSGRHLLSLINDVLDLSKVEAGQMTLDLEAETPSKLAAASLLIVRHQATVRQVTLMESIPAELGMLMLDVRKTKQMLSNLLANAVKFTPAGGSVSLRLARVGADALPVEDGDPTVRYFPPPGLGGAHWLQMEVADTGVGIAPTDLRKLFQPFVQVDTSVTRSQEGTGLGLTMVQRLAELHGGALQVRSVVGEGSTFTVWLPWRPADSPAAQHAPPVFAAPPAAKAEEPPDALPLVLVIDDDPQSAELLRTQLEPNGYRVEIAHDAEQGIVRAAALRPVVILLDVLMPRLDGWETLGRLKESPATAHIPVVIVSVTDEMRRGFALGAAQVLLKPVSKDELLEALVAIGLSAEAGGGRVLVVDDDPNAVQIVCRHLKTAGFECAGAYGGREALESVQRRRPTLIVLDLMMPHVSGFDVIERLASRPDTADIPILVLTSKLLTSHDRELLRGRVQRLIEKSEFEPASLLAEVRRAVVRGPAEREATTVF